jgi:hypothetical protein
MLIKLLEMASQHVEVLSKGGLHNLDSIEVPKSEAFHNSCEAAIILSAISIEKKFL